MRVAAAAVLSLVAAATTALALAGPTRGASESADARPRPAGTLSRLRLCALEQFDQFASECRRDGRTTALASTGLGCSATLRARRATRVLAILKYQGDVEMRLNIRVPRAGLYSVFVTLQFPTSLLPGGTYSCRFQLGRRGVGGSVRSAGPAEPIVGTAVCNSSSTTAPGASGCNADASVVPLTGDSITCSALFANRRGHEAAIELVHRADGVETVMGRVAGTLLLPLTEVYLAYSPSGGPAPGAYLCRYLLDGQVAAEKPFTIA